MALLCSSLRRGELFGRRSEDVRGVREPVSIPCTSLEERKEEGEVYNPMYFGLYNCVCRFLKVSDEVWATNDPMWKQWVTLGAEEDTAEFALLKRRPLGWMFWGSFAGGKKGPTFIWEKEFGGVTSHKYIFFILPMVASFCREEQLSAFQQDNAPSHCHDTYIART